MVTPKERPLYRRYHGLVATGNVAVVCPAGTRTSGIVAASATFELLSVTSAPPAGAGAPSVTVPVDAAPLPPAIVDGLSVSDTIELWAPAGLAESSAATSTRVRRGTVAREQPTAG